MHLFKITLAFSSMAALTLADTGMVKSVNNVLGIGMITPDKGGNDVPMVIPRKNVCHVCLKHISQAREKGVH
jgi:hypothetical protein